MNDGNYLVDRIREVDQIRSPDVATSGWIVVRISQPRLLLRRDYAPGDRQFERDVQAIAEAVKSSNRRRSLLAEYRNSEQSRYHDPVFHRLFLQ